MPRLKIESLRFQGRGPYDLTVEPGECVCLSGPSGAGKTLLLRSIADLDPHEGRVFLDDVDSLTVDAPSWRQAVGLLPAESQWWWDTVGPHFPVVDGERLEALGFGEEVLAWEVSRLSTGERQRLALLRLLVNRPRVLLLDAAHGRPRPLQRRPGRSPARGLSKGSEGPRALGFT